MGRSLKEEEPLTGIVAARLKEDEYEEFQEAMKTMGLTQSELLRQAIAAFIRKETQVVVVQQKMSEPKREILFLAKKTSNNVNQLAHKVNLAHLEGKVDKSLYTDLLSSFDMLMRYFKAII